MQVNMADHFQRVVEQVSVTQTQMSAVQDHIVQLNKQVVALSEANAGMREQIKSMTKTRVKELAPEPDSNGNVWRVFSLRVPDADRTHYGKYVGFSQTVCGECNRSAMQISFVVERLRPHEAQQDKLGRWIGLEFEKGHSPQVRGRLWVKFEVFRAADPTRNVTFTHNYNADGIGLEYDNQRGLLVNGKWGHIWGRSVLLTACEYANSVGPHGSLFVRFKLCFLPSPQV